MSERVRWVVGPTQDHNRQAPEDRYHWVAYEPDGTEHYGWSSTRMGAEEQAIAAIEGAHDAGT